MDQRVLDAQKWLNITYGNNDNYSIIQENGKTGNVVMEALVTALQIELEMSNITGYFGSQTTSAYNQNIVKYGDSDSYNNIIRILQHALYCKGYNPTAVTGYFGDNTLNAVKKVQKDAGYSDDMIGESLTAKVFKQILSCDALVCVSDGDEKIRKIQQTLNHDYGEMFDIIPCDGRYNSKMAKALIYAFQKEGGLGIDVANGNFGPATQNIAQSHVQSINAYEKNFVKLAKFALYCNGKRRNGINAFDCSSNDEFTGDFDDIMREKVIEFQKFTGMLEVTGKIELKEWMSLMVSSGYPKRNVLACDTATQLTDAKAKRLVANDFEIVGRYLTGSTVSANKFLTRNELNILFNNGLSVFAIYQDEKEYYREHPEEETTINYYSYDQGFLDAERAVTAAERLGIAYGECIFFSVDYDFNYNQTTDKIIPHFMGISNYIRYNGNKYKIGVYAARNICERVYNCGFAEMCFISDMSTGFSGNLGYALPEKWAFDQIREYTQSASDGAFNVDCVAISGTYRGFSSIVPESEQQPEVTSRQVAEKYVNSIYQVLGISLDQALFVDEHYELVFPDFELRTEYRVGQSVNIGKGSENVKFIIENGEYVGKEYEASIEILDNVSYDITYSDNITGSFDVMNKVKYSTDDGYVEVGVSISTDNYIKIKYVIHKNICVAEGLEEYIEIGLEITMRNSLTAEEYIEYNELREEVQNYSTQFPEWNLNKAWKFCLVCMVGFAIAKITIELILAVIRLILIGIAGAFA